MQDGRKSFRQIAREIGVSTPTVESHFSRMMGLGVIKNIVPILDSERLEKDLCICLSEDRSSLSNTDNSRQNLLHSRDKKCVSVNWGIQPNGEDNY